MPQFEKIEISVVLYQEGNCWIAQGLEYDITAQAFSLPELHQRFALKVAAEVVISIDLGKEPLQGLSPAPEVFWRMFEDAPMSVSAEPPPVRIEDGTIAPRIIPRMKIGSFAAAAA